ncbi:DUF1049 domain-containing protein [Rhodobacterales bacterium HKCCE3408]|nr:DUF1049 domain-containing protein [Rhodobacterales bacterium HKCCE3408]
MRAVKYLFLIIVALALVIIALANRDPVVIEVLPADLAAWVGWSFQLRLPLFLVILGGIVLGLLIGFVWEWLREHRHRAEAARERRQRTKLEREVQTLKGRSEDGQDDVLALIDRGGRAG